jgi:chromate transporter
MLAIPLVVVLLLALAYTRFAAIPAVSGALRGMAAVSAGMMGAAGLRLATALRSHPIPLPWSIALCATAFALVALLQVPLGVVLLAIGGLGCVMCWHRIAP